MKFSGNAILDFFFSMNHRTNELILLANKYIDQAQIQTGLKVNVRGSLEYEVERGERLHDRTGMKYCPLALSTNNRPVRYSEHSHTHVCI